MKVPFNKLHKAFESRVRLGIMSILAANESVDFNSLKEYLDITDGNLASHIKALEKEEFISVEKLFLDRKPNTKYYITAKGRREFVNHLKNLEKIIKAQK